MSWLTSLFSTPAAAGYAMGANLARPIKSPWTPSTLTRVAVSELTGIKMGAIGRDDLMKIPPFVRGRGLICGTLSRFPLVAVDGTVQSSLAAPAPKLPEQPAWLTSTKSGQPVALRTAWTLDDLIVEGLGVWATMRDENQKIVDAMRLAPGVWSVDPDSRALMIQLPGGEKVAAKTGEVMIFESWQDGVLKMADEQARASRNLANAWQQRVATPIPLISLEQQDANEELDDDEIDDMIDDWEAARTAGGTAFLRAGIKANVLGSVTPDLYVQGRNADRLDWANILSLPASLLEGSLSTASLTYSTADGKRSEFVDYSLATWAMPMEARASQDDVTDPGTAVRFDISWLTNPVQQGSNPPMED